MQAAPVPSVAAAFLPVPLTTQIVVGVAPVMSPAGPCKPLPLPVSPFGTLRASRAGTTLERLEPVVLTQHRIVRATSRTCAHRRRWATGRSTTSRRTAARRWRSGIRAWIA